MANEQERGGKKKERTKIRWVILWDLKGIPELVSIIFVKQEGEQPRRGESCLLPPRTEGA